MDAEPFTLSSTLILILLSPSAKYLVISIVWKVVLL
nr:MAG TPA: hypothetical protein [Caudoviricetes sp.]